MSRILTGTYLRPNGEPVKGRVMFTPSVRVKTSTSFIVDAPVTVRLDATGSFEIELECTDDEATYPTGWTWKIVEKFEGGSTFYIELPSGEGSVDIADLAQMSTAPSVSYVGPPGPQGETGEPGADAVITFGTTAGTVTEGNDARLSDARTPTAHTHPQTDVSGLVDSLASKAPRTGLYLVSGNYVSAPSSASLNITTDLEVEWHGSSSDWTPGTLRALVGRYTSSGNQHSWGLFLMTDGKLRIYGSTDGASTFSLTSTVAPAVADGADLSIKVTLDVDNGAAGKTATFYTSSDDGVTWTQLGAPVTSATAVTLYNSTAIMEIGSVFVGTNYNHTGTVRRVVVRNGIGGPVVASPNFEAPNGPRHRDAQGNIWTINGSAWAWGLA